MPDTSILYFIESYLQPANFAMMMLGIKNYSLEHLMPKKWRNHWTSCATDEEARERDIKLLTLGNLAIIPQALNASIRDGDWSTKKVGKGEDKPGLQKCAAGLITMHDVLEKDVWNEETIDDRAEWLYKNAKSIWHINLPSDYEGLKGSSITKSEAEKDDSVPNNNLADDDIHQFEKVIGKSLKKLKKQTYVTNDGKDIYHLRISKKYNRGSNYQYWYRFEPKSDGPENGYENTYSAFFLADDAKVTIIPSELIMQNFSNLGSTPSSDGKPKYYHIFIRSVGDGKFSLILREPASDVDVTKYTYKLE